VCPNKWHAIQDLCCLGFFFLLRPGEYAAPSATDEDTNSTPFCLKHVFFLRDDSPSSVVNGLACSAHDSKHAYCGLRFDDQKNAHKGETVTQQATNQLLCPVRALYGRTVHLLQHEGTPDTPLYTYYNSRTASFNVIKPGDLTNALRSAASACYNDTGIPPQHISARSLRPGGATALLCAGIAKDTVKLLGRWRSDAVDTYLRAFSVTVTKSHSRKMLEHGRYKFASYQATDTTMPDLLPDSAADSIKRAYLEVLLHDIQRQLASGDGDDTA
jgi:hypothetical protein